MATLLIKNADAIVTMDDKNTVLNHTDMLIVDGIIKEIGKNIVLDTKEDTRVIDAAGKIVYPGLINTHHHLYQTLTRNISAVQNMELFPWLRALYQLWKNLTADMGYWGGLAGMGELVKYGCTTISDHHYVFPKNQTNILDEEIRAAKDLGVRIHACRGSMSRGESLGGLPPDILVQTTEEILADSERVIQRYHDKSYGSMCQIALAPCSPFSVTEDLMIESARLARKHGVRLHTHLTETLDEEKYTLETVGMRPLAYMESLGWTGSDVWFAHGIHFNDEELALLKRTQTGVAHCPISNMKLSSGIARVTEMLEMGIPVGLAVDGSASNDGSNLLAEIRSAYLLQRLRYSKSTPAGSEFLRLATVGSSKVLGRNDLGSLELGKMGDFFMIEAGGLEMAGCLDDVASIPAVVGYNKPVEMTVVNGKVIFEDGVLLGIDERAAAKEINKIAAALHKN